jgi:RNA polymerase sigma-70 factor (ECF subfamily)
MEGDQAMSTAEAMDEGKKDALLTSDTMIQAMKATGDPEAWKRFLKIYGPLMVRWNTDHGVQPADAADVAQEIALYVFNNIHRFDRRHPGAFRAWLRAIAHNKIRRMRETRARAGAEGNGMPEIVDSNGGGTWAPDYCESILQRGLEIIREEFEPSTWAAFEAVYLGSGDPAEVGRGLGMSRNAVYIARSRVLARLRAVLRGVIDDEAIQ